MANKGLQECQIIAVEVPWGSRVRSKEREREKIGKYRNWKGEVAAIWGMKKLIVVPLIIGALGTVS